MKLSPSRSCSLAGQVERRRAVPAGDVDRERLRRVAAARVVDAQQDGLQLLVGCGRQPLQHAGRRVERRAGRAVEKHPRQHGAVGIGRRGLVAVGDARGRRRQRRRGEHRDGVRERHRVDAAAEVQVLVLRVRQGDRRHLRRRVRREDAVRQAGADVDQPETVGAHRRADGGSLEEPRRVEHEQERDVEVVRGAVRHLDVERDRPGGAVGTRREERDVDERREVVDRVEGDRVRRGQLEPGGGADPLVDGQGVGVAGGRLEAQRRRPRRGVVVDLREVDPRAGAVDEHVVVGVQHRVERRSARCGSCRGRT